jgi:aspartate/methionine/tyrosine aminotransferase
MEDWLEAHRFSAKYNAGESGHVAQSLGAVLQGLQPDFDFDLREALTRELLCDSPNMGIDLLRDEVAMLHPGARRENVLITTGTSEALLLLLRQLAPRRVAVIVPAFQLLTSVPRSLGAEIVALPLVWKSDGQPHAPVEAWQRIIGEQKPDVFIFNHPHNPSGLVFNAHEREALLESCAAVGCTVVGDEHYRFLCSPDGAQNDPPHFSDFRISPGPTVWQPSTDRFVTGSFIKCAGTPGLRIGWCVGDESVLAAMQSEKNYLTHTVNPLSQRIALWFLESFRRKQTFFAPLYRDWQKNRNVLATWLSKNEDAWLGMPPLGGLVSCITPVDASESAKTFLKLREQGIFLLPLSSFMETGMTDGVLSQGFRIGLGLSPQQFEEMLSVMVR